MKTIFEYTNISASDRLEMQVKDKLDMIEEKFPFVIRADIFFKKTNASNSEKAHHCGIRLSAPGPRIYASSDENNFIDAINETIRDLKDQLERRKEGMKAY
ncbi:HPF/RaiA family ribosome-associated protein [uncultured Aquimarina sp.]|uniref:HPF/RaiA family ribosome-associated protein n=1 Tax=uncultured Aquimarina sp. TaxID=575652 RepID=UPI002608BFC8|nr:HPF/RaiA family ribosome-associated protein [uncultured Aquimarina sp.]